MVFASTVRFTTNTALTGPLVWGFVGWVVKWIYCFTDLGFVPFFGVLLILVVLVVLARGLHPVSFPNLEVKPFCADGTATGGLWESRALPTVSFGGGGVWSCLGVDTPTIFLFVVCVWGVGSPPILRLGDRHRCLRSSQYVNLTLSA